MIKSISLFIAVLCSTFVLSQSYGLDWAISATDTLELGGYVKPVSQAVDANGNLFVIGYLRENADFDPSSSEYNLTSKSQLDDLFLVKYDDQLNFVWAKNIGGRGIDHVSSITVDSDGNLVFTGNFKGRLFYDANQDSSSIKIDYDPGQYIYWPEHGYILKYDTDGNHLWSQIIPTLHSVYPSEVVTDSDNNIILVGKFKHQALFGSNYQDTLFSDGSWDVFFTKYDSLGNYVWGYSIGGTGDDEGTQIAIDNDDNLFMSGIIQGSVDMDPSAGIAIETATTHHFLAKYDSLGGYSWSHCFNQGSYTINDLAIDQANDIVFTGSIGQGAYLEKRDTSGSQIWNSPFSGTSNLPLYVAIDLSNQIFVAGEYNAFASNDNLFFTKHNNTTGYQLSLNLIEGSHSNNISGLTLSAADGPIITGYFIGTTDFDTGPSVTTIATLNQSVSSYYKMGFVSKYANSGALNDVFSIGNHYFLSYIQGGYSDFGDRITVDSDKSAYASGLFENATDFDPSAGEAILTTTPVYSYSGNLLYRDAAFLVKYDSLSNYQWSVKYDSVYTYPNHITNSSDETYFMNTMDGTVDIDPSSNTQNLSAEVRDGALVKYDKNGQLIWGFLLETTTSSSESILSDILLDSIENIVITGTFKGSVNFDPLGSNTVYTATNSNSSFIAKYDSNGSLLWFKDMNSVPLGQVRMTVDEEFIVAGSLSGTYDFDPSPTNTYTLTTWPYSNIYMAKYNELGDFQWAHIIIGPGLEYVSDFEVGDEYFYLYGAFEDSIDLDPTSSTQTVANYGGFSTFLARYKNSDGSLDWGFALDGAGAPNTPHALDLDQDENVAIYGNFSAGTGQYSPFDSFFDVDPSPDTVALKSCDVPPGFWGGFIAKYDSLGDFIWATDFNGGTTFNSTNMGDIYVNDDLMYVTGSFEYHTDFTPSSIFNPLV
ncbi:MAG: hypothetical protein AB8B56_15900, partial [Crocinitomicaceae bacterium]